MGTPLSRKAGSEEQIGDVKHSVLTEAQFQSLHGATWVLMDGRSVAGSDIATLFLITTLPDARGQFLRGKNNGRVDGQENPDGELALGAQTTDKYASHGHTYSLYLNGGSNSGTEAPSFSGGAAAANSTPASGSNETAPKNLTVNVFIKINKA